MDVRRCIAAAAGVLAVLAASEVSASPSVAVLIFNQASGCRASHGLRGLQPVGRAAHHEALTELTGPASLDRSLLFATCGAEGVSPDGLSGPEPAPSGTCTGTRVHVTVALTRAHRAGRFRLGCL